MNDNPFYIHHPINGKRQYEILKKSCLYAVIIAS